MISNKLASIPDSYFGKTMGRNIEHGPLPLINMAVGIPDGATPQGIIEHFQKALAIPENQKYGAFHGKDTFKQAIVDFYQRQYDVTLDKEDEVCILYGTKNGLVAVPTCIINPGDYVLLPDPGYTDYLAGVLLADGKPVPLNLEPPHYLPDWSIVDSQVIDKTKLIYLTYPNNPTGSTATKEVFDEAIAKFTDTDTKIVHDFAYGAFGFDAKNPSILSSENGKDVAIEIYSLSKGYNMSGFRVGFAVGNKDMIQALKKYQTHTNAGMFGALQDAATYALNHYDDFLEEQSNVFKVRRDRFEDILSKADLPFVHAKGGIYVWLETPPGYDSEQFEKFLVKEKSILVAPGKPFGENGNRYVRISLALDDQQLEEAATRLTELVYLYE
ncbi:aminotransferase class I/II-fold pyridoxal phosphate-dependent enzyme [Staphylococcus schweitzeri]|uniref:aminotransferase class I/II-fold pyridoxal phosphate-dependent enzyme n=1 Tax=Staphylococcus schweitzeri TaxID=1654388 RepID=UPI000500443B|nr:aminotransferase class I/II-fold pyridoxal phosphate-dependent enzyme [Staphylococcus schweitzeri]CDR26151.1 aspartate aminotransferase [Staphylococcus schweitzeri]